MVRERIKELVDFATSESPYRDANKGWLNDDVFIQWGASEVSTSQKGVEVANVSFFWKPINQIVSILFAVVLGASAFVFVSVSISHGRISIPVSVASNKMITEEQSVIQKTFEIQQAQPVKTVDVIDLTTVLKQEPIPDLKQEPIPDLKQEPIPEQTSSISSFGAAALGGQKLQR